MDAKEFEKQLMACKTREEGLAILNKLSLADMLILAHKMDVKSSFNIKTLKERIVQSTIGAKLESESI